MELPRTPSLRLDGRRALVTGAGRGIGLACAAALAQAGAHVVLAARTTSEIDEVAESIRRDGGTGETITLDITDLSGATAAIAGLEAFDILVNNAAGDVPRRNGGRLRLHGGAQPAGGILRSADSCSPDGRVG
jgi:NAD(P)-dependent dehydrogenase (short-subunit alcohol dehydrogenase family)